MSNLYPITLTVTGNEKALALCELNEQSPGSRGFHRYQTILVVRDGKASEFRRDMGLSKNFKGCNQINIPSLLEHTVDELLGLADELRWEVRIDVKELIQLEHYKVA